MNSLTAYQQPESYCENDDNRHYLLTTPYDNSSWPQVAQEFNVKVPNDIVDRSQGSSTCTLCGQKYNGYQTNCTRERQSFTYNYGSTAFGSLMKGDRYRHPNWDGWYAVISHGYSPCKGACRWDLEVKFNEQKDFFNFLNTLSSCPKEDFSVFSKFSHLMPPGTAAVVEHRHTLQKIQNLEMENIMLKQALSTIASKMNSAGHALSFGF